MTNQHKHPVRGLRGIPEDLWTEAEAAAKAANSDRSALIRQFEEAHYKFDKPDPLVAIRFRMEQKGAKLGNHTLLRAERWVWTALKAPFHRKGK